MKLDALLRRVRSLRFRLTILATAAVAMILIVGGGLLLVGLQRVLTASVQDAASARAETVVLLVRTGELPDVVPVADEEDTFVQVVAPDGTVVAASDNIVGEPSLATVGHGAGETSARSIDDHPLEDDASVRLLEVGVATTEGDRTVVVGESLESVDEAVAIATSLGLSGLPVLGLGVGVIAWWLVGRALTPVEAIRREADEIGGGDLHRRVPVASREDEIARLGRTVNGMLARLEESARRQQQFVGDAAHELRSPVASLRTQLETALGSRRDVDWGEVSADLLAETLRMQDVIEQLLLLAQVDAVAGVGSRRTVDLDELVGRAVAWAGDHHGRDLRVVRVAAEALQVAGDEVLLLQVIRNLLDNAARHASSTVTVACRSEGSDAVLSVSDDGDGIPVQDRERVFERFVRLDDARSRDAGGSGLGLALVRDIVVDHDGSVRIADSVTGCTVEVRLPLLQAT